MELPQIRKMYPDQHQLAYAPFGSTSPKKVINKNQKVVFPGPGSYNVSIPLAQPSLQILRTNLNNVIVKINKKQTSNFKSQNQRFQIRQNQVPGPGYYSNNSSSQNRSHHYYKKNSLRQYKLKFFENKLKQRPTIPEKIIGPKPQVIQTPVQSFIGKDSKITKWKQGNRFQKQKNQQSPGPGTYQTISYLEDNKRSNSGVGFNSQSSRSIFDAIVHGSNQQLVALMRQKMNYKFISPQPGPGSYQTDIHKLKNSFHHFFGSVQNRFKKSEIGYNVQIGAYQRNIFDNSKKKSAIINPQRVQEYYEEDMDKGEEPGPGSYQIIKPFQYISPKKIANVKLRKIQEKCNSFKKTSPGPGSYQININKKGFKSIQTSASNKKSPKSKAPKQQPTLTPLQFYQIKTPQPQNPKQSPIYQQYKKNKVNFYRKRTKSNNIDAYSIQGWNTNKQKIQ